MSLANVNRSLESSHASGVAFLLLLELSSPGWPARLRETHGPVVIASAHPQGCDGILWARPQPAPLPVSEPGGDQPSPTQPSVVLRNCDRRKWWWF